MEVVAVVAAATGVAGVGGTGEAEAEAAGDVEDAERGWEWELELEGDEGDDAGAGKAGEVVEEVVGKAAVRVADVAGAADVVVPDVALFEGLEPVQNSAGGGQQAGDVKHGEGEGGPEVDSVEALVECVKEPPRHEIAEDDSVASRDFGVDGQLD